jgi:hypothetical protein
MCAASGPEVEGISVERLLPHLVEVTAHAQRLGAAPEKSTHVLNAVVVRLREAGQLDISRPLISRALDTAQAHLGPDHPATLYARSNLASWLGRSGQVNEALTQFRQLLDDYERLLGPDHPATLTTRNNLGYCQDHLRGRRSDSEKESTDGA